MDSSVKQAVIPVTVLLVVVSLGIVATWPSGSVEAEHYQRFRDGKSLYTLLSSSIQPGDSLQTVERVLGPGVLVTEEAETTREAVRREVSLSPEIFRDGVHSQDVFINYPHGDEFTTLQFRNGYLVNHDPGLYRNTEPGITILGRDETIEVSGEEEVIQATP